MNLIGQNLSHCETIQYCLLLRFDFIFCHSIDGGLDFGKEEPILAMLEAVLSQSDSLFELV